MSFLTRYGFDEEVANLISSEENRLINTINLIASENIPSHYVMEAMASMFTTKYAEGYPNKRYYNGCINADRLEQLAIDRCCELFNCKYANVQPHSGSNANLAVYNALLNPGDTILSMSVSEYGHLTHGSKVNISGNMYNVIHYTPDKDGIINTDDVKRLALEYKPKMIIAGGSAYPRWINFYEFRKICDEVGAYLFVDMAHFAGIVAAMYNDIENRIPFQNPVNYADVLSFTTHKTLKGPRGGCIITNREDIIEKVNKSVFPGVQGGPLMNVIAAKAVCFKEAISENYYKYIIKVLNNSKRLAHELIKQGCNLITDGTDTHLVLMNAITEKTATGKDLADKLETIGIIVNKNMIPGDIYPPIKTSGIRIGTPLVTSLGYDEMDMVEIASIIKDISDISADELVSNISSYKVRVQNIVDKKQFKNNTI